MDLDKLVRTEERSKTNAVLVVASAQRAAARDEHVDEARLLEALRIVGKSVEDFAHGVRGVKSRMADVVKIGRLPEIETNKATRAAARKAAEEAFAPAFHAHHRQLAAWDWEDTMEGQEVYPLQMLKNELARTNPDAVLTNARAAEEDRVRAMERDLKKATEAKENADAKRDRKGLDEEQKAEAQVNYAKHLAKMGELRIAIEEAKVNMARLDEELAMS